ncbi:MAG: septum formation protein Maf [Anaerolineae bacterium]|nr:septum formation protein Maf [Anaerolineae bacterium]
MRLILASSSPRRRELLAGLGLRFEIIKPDIDESRRAAEDLVEYAERLSREKAEAVARTLDETPALVISADTIVMDGGELLGKPADDGDARRMLWMLRGREHEVVTAFTLYRAGDAPRVITRHARTAVEMRAFSEAEIDAYVATGDPLDKAGAYGIQNEEFRPVARIEGSYSNVVGLPLEALKAALGDIGFVFSPQSNET